MIKSLEQILQEIYNKGLLDKDKFEELLLELENQRKISLFIAGLLDSSVAHNKITAEQAKPYFEQLPLRPEDLDAIRTNHQDEREKRKRLN